MNESTISRFIGNLEVTGLEDDRYGLGFRAINTMEQIQNIVSIRIPYDAFHKIAAGNRFRFQPPRDRKDAYELTWAESLSRYIDQNLCCIVQPDVFSDGIVMNFLIPKEWKPNTRNPWWNENYKPGKDFLYYRLANPGDKPCWNDVANILEHFGYDIEPVEYDDKTKLPFEVKVMKKEKEK